MMQKEQKKLLNESNWDNYWPFVYICFWSSVKKITTPTVVKITPRSSPPNNAPSVVPTFASSMFHVQEDNAIYMT